MCIFNVAKCAPPYKYADSDERIRRLEDYVSNEILTYLRLLRLENEQRLRLLGQTGANGGPQYSSDYADVEWPQRTYDQEDWLQDSYDSTINPGQLALWQNSPFANRRLQNPGVGRRFKIPPFSMVNGGKMRNAVPPYPPFSLSADNTKGMPESIQGRYPQGVNNNGYMQSYKVPPRISNNQPGSKISSFTPDSYNLKLGQIPGKRKQIGTIQPDLQNESEYQIESTGSVTPPSVLSKPSISNIASPNLGSVSGTLQKPNMKMSNVPSSGQATVNIDSAESESTFETGVRSLTPRRKMQGDNLNGVRSTSHIVGDETKQGNKRYKVILVNGDEGEEVSFDDVNKKLFSQGFDSTGGVKTMAAAASSSSGGNPQNSFQTVSVSNNGKGATIMSSPTSNSKNTISLQSGDESAISSVVETQPRNVGTKYQNSGFGNFGRINGLVTNGHNNVKLN